MYNKEYNYVTSKAFLISSEIKFNDFDYKILGSMYTQEFIKQSGGEPLQVLTINSKKRKTKSCSLYPISFVPVMEEITINYFSNLSSEKSTTDLL